MAALGFGAARSAAGAAFEFEGFEQLGCHARHRAGCECETVRYNATIS
jgi:hypothetical protein